MSRSFLILILKEIDVSPACLDRVMVTSVHVCHISLGVPRMRSGLQCSVYKESFPFIYSHYVQETGCYTFILFFVLTFMSQILFRNNNGQFWSSGSKDHISALWLLFDFQSQASFSLCSCGMSPIPSICYSG